MTTATEQEPGGAPATSADASCMPANTGSSSTCNVQAIRSILQAMRTRRDPPGHANPESLIADLIGISSNPGQSAAGRHGTPASRGARCLIPVSAANLHLKFYTSKIFPEKL
jgi:hypothetical protein